MVDNSVPIHRPFQNVLTRSHCCQMGHWLPGQCWGLSGARIWISGTKNQTETMVTLAPLLRLCLMEAEASV